MSRSGYSDNCDGWELIMYRGAVTSAMRGKRGQKFLRELVAALDAMSGKRLVEGRLEHDGEVCALGSVGKLRGLPMDGVDYEDESNCGEQVATMFGIAPAMAREIMYENDDELGFGKKESPERRWSRMREWAVANLKDQPPRGADDE